MARYTQKKIYCVEAHQWTGSNFKEMFDVALTREFDCVQFGQYHNDRTTWCKLVSENVYRNDNSQLLNESNYIVFDGEGVIIMSDTDFCSTYIPAESSTD